MDTYWLHHAVLREKNTTVGTNQLVNAVLVRDTIFFNRGFVRCLHFIRWDRENIRFQYLYNFVDLECISH